MNSGDKDNQECILGLCSLDSYSSDLDFDSLLAENAPSRCKCNSPLMGAESFTKELENYDIDNIDSDESSTRSDYNQMSSASNSQNLNGSVHEGTVHGDIDIDIPLGRLRECSLDSIILGNFFKIKKQSKEPPKKEYIRMSVIRGHKRAHRQIFKKNKEIKNCLHAFKAQNKAARLIWDILANYSNKKIEDFKEICKTESGPATDGKAKRPRGKASSRVAKSWNDTACRNYFSIKKIRKSYFWYIELIFADSSPRELCNKLKIFCCDGNYHSSKCIIKWYMMHAYLNDIMIQDLGIAPWFHARYCQKTIEEVMQIAKVQPQIKNKEILEQYTENISC